MMTKVSPQERLLTLNTQWVKGWSEILNIMELGEAELSALVVTINLRVFKVPPNWGPPLSLSLQNTATETFKYIK